MPRASINAYRIFNDHRTDIINYLWDFPIEDVDELIETFAEEGGFTCKGCGLKSYYNDNNQQIHIKSGKQMQQHGKKVGRNEPCHCKSGKKYKKCCGKVQ